MSHSNHAAMGSMSMGEATPLVDYPKFYWAVVASAVAIATLVNIYNHVLYRQRLSAAKSGSLQPAKPKRWPIVAMATMFAITRELSHYSMRVPLKQRMLRLPTLGRSSLILANIMVLVVLGLSGLDLHDPLERENVGYRLGFVSITQLPLIFLLAGKNNIIGYLTGISYERLNWLHRWCARCLLLTATLHMGYFLSAWAPYDYISVQFRENTLVWKGLVAWVMLIWIVFSSFAPIRGWCYEFFVVQHLISFAVMIGFIYIHTPAEVHVYVWLPVGIFFLDRVLRILRLLYANVSLFHSKLRKNGQHGFLACRAEFIPLPHNTTRVVIQNPPITWMPGQHVFLSCHSIVPLQSHPFTIASVPADGRMEFLIRAETGGTLRFFKHAEKTHGRPATADQPCVKTVAIEGPYGCLRPLRQFDSVVLLAGSTGATFTVPLLRDIVQGWKENVAPGQNSPSLLQTPTGAVTRHVRFVWIVKSRGQLSWFSEHLSSVYKDFQQLQEQARHIKLELTVFVTCDESFTEEHKTLLSTMTFPNPAVAAKKPSLAPRHGSVKYNPSTLPSDEDEKKKMSEPYQEDIKEVRANSPQDAQEERTERKTCSCKTTVDESSSPEDAIQTTCCCSNNNSNNDPRQDIIATNTTSSHPTVPPPQSLPISRVPPPPSPSSSSSKSTNSTVNHHPPRKPSPPAALHPHISVYAGRPSPRDILRRSLEQALGESAVVVCGPAGLVADVRHHVAALSDERAVHKGTGAQGVYLHTESFGW